MKSFRCKLLIPLILLTIVSTSTAQESNYDELYLTSDNPEIGKGFMNLSDKFTFDAGNIYNLTIHSLKYSSHDTNLTIYPINRDYYTDVYQYSKDFQPSQNGTDQLYPAWTILQPDNTTYVLVEGFCGGDILGDAGLSLSAINNTDSPVINTTIGFTLQLYEEALTATTCPVNFPILTIPIFSLVALIYLKSHRNKIKNE